MRLNLFGINIDNLTMEETLNKIEGFIRSKKPHQHIVVNVNKIIKAAKDEKIKEIINNCDLVNVDGMPVVWASRFLGKPLKERVAGIDLFEALLRRSRENKWRLYFLGAEDDVVVKLMDKIQARYPAVNIAGYRNGYWDKKEEPALVDKIRTLSVDILFVGIPSPAKEIFLNKYMNELNIPLVMGVGGSFDVLSGKVKRAPLWMQKMALEWFYRFLKEPRRLFKRYFIEGPYFIYLVFKEWNRREKCTG